MALSIDGEDMKKKSIKLKDVASAELDYELKKKYKQAKDFLMKHDQMMRHEKNRIDMLERAFLELPIGVQEKYLLAYKQNKMARTKSEVLKKHKESKRIKTKAKIVEVRNGRQMPAWDVEVTEDLNGYYKKTVLKADSSELSPWTEEFKGTPRVIIKDFDFTGVELILTAAKNRPEIKIDINYGDLCDIVTAFEAMEYLHKKRTGRVGKTPVKIGKVKMRKLK